MKAIWNEKVIAESDKTIMIEGNHYFPIDSVKKEYLKESKTNTHCFWKGEASYYNVKINGDENEDAAWYYPEPMKLAEMIKDHIAFWHGVKVTK